MAERFVTDSSVALKWFLDDEAGIPEARRILAECLADNFQIVVPPHFFFEVGNGLIVATRRKRMGEALFQNAWKDFLMIPFASPPWSNSLYEMSMSLSFETNLSFYDAAYIALAKNESIPLVTGDNMVLEAMKRIGLAVSYIG
jgi:predicted nucleic acid-binding protein